MNIQVHPLTHNPNVAYQELSRTHKFTKLDIYPPTKKVAPNKARVVCMSDTHSATSQLKFAIPNGHIFIHAGDFTKLGVIKEVKEFNTWIKKLPHKYKIVIAGNHELSFDPKCMHSLKSHLTDSEPEITNGEPLSNIKQILTGCIYLQDSMVEIYGLKIYGSPWQPKYGGWAFNIERGQPCLNKWDMIPSDTDILVTHGPPLGHGDLTSSGQRAGCVELLTSIQKRIKPKYHVFGHIHEGYGISTDDETIYINAATCNVNYTPINQPIVFDIDLPLGQEIPSNCSLL